MHLIVIRRNGFVKCYIINFLQRRGLGELDPPCAMWGEGGMMHNHGALGL
jgi:hypothetical protein